MFLSRHGWIVNLCLGLCLTNVVLSRRSPDGWCWFNSVGNSSELKGCERIRGNLEMREFPDKTVPYKVKEVTGCVRIIVSELVNLDFLEFDENAKGKEVCENSGQKSRVLENDNLCVTPRIKRILANGYGAEFRENMKDNCHEYCSGNTFEKNYDRNVYQEVVCHFLSGSLKVQNVKVSDRWLSSIKKLKEINNGSIELNNLEHKTMDFFDELTQIVPLGNGPDIVIRNNANLEKIVLPPKLARKPKIIVRGNRKLSQKTLDELKNLAAEGSEIQEQGECGFSSLGVTEESQLEGCSVIGSELTLKIPKTVKRISHKIGHVDGCINIQFAENLESLDFLTFDRRDKPYCTGTSEIENNEKLCLVPREERLLKELYKASISGNKKDCDNQKHCKDGTSFDKIMKDEFECSEFTGTLLMKGPFFWQKSIRSIRKINGKVVLDDTALQNLDMFIDLKKLNTPNSDDYAFEIINNAQLTDLKFSPNLPKMKIKVRGNKLLDEQSIKYLNLAATSAPGSDIQEFGECPFVNNPSDLAGCKSVQNDFNLISTPIAQVTENIRTVGGCIQIKNTSLTNLNFLKFEDTSKVNCAQGSEISNNKNLCILPKQKTVLESVYKATIKDNANEDCATVCDATTLKRDYSTIKQNQQVCKTLKGKLVIENNNARPAWLSLLENVAKIDGGNIVIRNNKFENFNIFPKLKEIKYTGSDPAISVTNNPNLNQFSLAALKQIKDTSTVLCLEFKNNDQLSKSDREMLVNVFNQIRGCRINMPEHPVSTTQQPNQVNEPVEVGFSSGSQFVLLIMLHVIVCLF